MNYNINSFLHRLCIAPMLHYTDRHFRYFMRLMTKHTFLYTEMQSTAALLHKRNHLIPPLDIEHPIAFQICGHNPIELAQCARWVESVGYDEINFNVGCPSERAQIGQFGACLLGHPQQILDCIKALKQSVSIPVSIKMRIGLVQSSVDLSSINKSFEKLVEQLKEADCLILIIHARLAQMSNWSPKANRTQLPLHYELIYQLKRRNPKLEIILNGGIVSLDQAKSHLEKVDGVMIGQAACKNPYLFSGADSSIFNKNSPILSREEVFEQYKRYIEEKQKEGISEFLLKRPLLGLYHGFPHAKSWRSKLIVK